jgi:ectoine hydroxylase-related dioxygenase (phytanoyl-CoA dioxygenase family)
METNPHEHDDFLASLHKDADTYRHVHGSFLGRKGDILIWHADLAHGASRRLSIQELRAKAV